MKRDVAIIGGGPAAIYAAYEFALKYPDIPRYKSCDS